MLGQFQKAGVPPKRRLGEFRVTEDALLPIGATLNAAHFIPGQYVDVCSKRYVCVCDVHVFTLDVCIGYNL